jgi:phosphatidate cytidylyltransferase
MPAIRPSATVLWALGGILAILVVATLVTELLVRRHPERNYAELRLRVRSWWIMAGLFSLRSR